MTNRKQMTMETLFEDYQNILKETLKVLPVGYLPNHTFKSIPDRVENYVKENTELNNNIEKYHNEVERLEQEVNYQFPALLESGNWLSCYDIGRLLIEKCNKTEIKAYDAADELRDLKERIKEDYVYFAGFGADANADTEHQLNFLFQSKLDTADAKSVGREKFHRYEKALEEIVKRPQKSETCKMIAQKALGLLTDDEYQPELLIEENLKLKIELEDLKTKMMQKELDKVFKPEYKRTCNSTELTETYENSPLTHCKHCGEYIGYHHWEFCKGNGTMI